MRQNSSLQNLLIESVCEVLRQGIDLLEAIDDETYSGGANAVQNNGAVGGHFRHCLEFINCFLGGAENGRVDYNERRRDSVIETRREYAIGEYRRTIAALEKSGLPDGEIFVKPEDVARDADFWCDSSVARELEFLHSHTIHHYALIGFKLRARGIEVPDEFGVAPSTLRFWSQGKAANR